MRDGRTEMQKLFYGRAQDANWCGFIECGGRRSAAHHSLTAATLRCLWIIDTTGGARACVMAVSFARRQLDESPVRQTTAVVKRAYIYTAPRRTIRDKRTRLFVSQ